MNSPSLCILLVEDDQVDTEHFLRCLHRQGSSLDVTVIDSAFRALQMLRGEHSQPPLTGPCLILLDLYLAGMNGFEFLEELRSDSRLKVIPVIVLSHSTSEQDRRRAYGCGVAAYLNKVVFQAECQPLIDFLESYRDAITVPVLK